MQFTRIIRKCHITETLLKFQLFWLELKVSFCFFGLNLKTNFRDGDYIRRIAIFGLKFPIEKSDFLLM